MRPIKGRKEIFTFKLVNDDNAESTSFMISLLLCRNSCCLTSEDSFTEFVLKVIASTYQVKRDTEILHMFNQYFTIISKNSGSIQHTSSSTASTFLCLSSSSCLLDPVSNFTLLSSLSASWHLTSFSFSSVLLNSSKCSSGKEKFSISLASCMK